MINYKNNTLSIDGSIDTADSILTLSTDIDAMYIGHIILANGATKTLSFVKDDKVYRTRLVITEEDLPYLNSCTFYLTMVAGTLSGKTNAVAMVFDTAAITRTVRMSLSHEAKDLRLTIAKLESRLNDFINNSPSFLIAPSTPVNTNYVKPGMIPVAIDETGRCIFQYPFIDHITEINGQHTVNGAILLTAEQIPIDKTNVASAIKGHTEAIKELVNMLNTLSAEFKTVNSKVAEIESKLLQHTDTSII